MSSRRWNRALVTGASSGIGAQVCRQLAERGTGLVLVARSKDRLDALAHELEAAHGIEADVLSADLIDPLDLERVAERIGRGDIDLVVNNAGFGSSGRFHDLEVARELAQVQLNVVAVSRLTHAAIAAMRPRRHGGILNVSSVAGFQPVPGLATYSGTKAFVTTFTQAVHEELRDSGVHVTALCPGSTATEFQERAGTTQAARRLPKRLWTDLETVVREGLDGVAANRAVVVPGVQFKAMAAFSQILPDALTRRASLRMRPLP